MSWHAIRIRGDLYRILQARAAEEHRSVAGQADVLLSQALESASGDPSPPASSRAPAVEAGGSRDARTASSRSASPAHQVPAGAAHQTTVDEMLASCPNCAGDLYPRESDGREVCAECGYVREP
jgi:ribosomal protein S27AE